MSEAPDIATPLVPRVEARPQPLGENRDFLVLLSTQGLSALGDAVTYTALPLLVLALTGSGFAMGVVGTLQALPDLFLAMVAGAIADRSDRKRMMLVADLGRAILTALIPISVLVGGPTMAVVLLVAAPMSIFRTFFLAGYTASVPGLVGRSQIARANAAFEAVYSTGFIVGPAIAGLLAATIGPGPTLAIDAASFALSSIGLLFVRRELRAPVDREHGSLLADIREGIAYIRHDPVLRPAVLFWGATSIVFASLVTALAVHITVDLGESASALGLVLTGYGIGTVAGAVLVGRLPSRRPIGPALLGGNFVMAGCLIAISLVASVPVMVAIAALAGVSQSLVLVTYITTRTAYSPDALLGRIGSTARTISLGLQPVGYLVGGALIDATSGSTTIAVMGVVVAFVTLAFVPVRALRTASLQPR